MNCPYCQASNQQSDYCETCHAELQQEATLTPSLSTGIDTIDAATLATMDLPPNPPIVKGLIPAGLTVLAGRPKAGKSWLVADLAIAIASGNPWNGSPVDAGPVLYVAMEDTHARLQERIGKLSPSPPASLHLALTCDGIAALEAWIVAHKPRMAILDTLQCWRGGKASTYHRDYEEGARLKALADKYSMSIVVIHHTTKVKPANPLDSVSGSTGLTGAADAILVLGTCTGKGALWATGRDIPTTVLPLVWDRCRWSLPSSPMKQLTHATESPTLASAASDAKVCTMPALAGPGVTAWTVGFMANGFAVYSDANGARDAMARRGCVRFSDETCTEDVLRSKFASIGVKYGKLVKN